MKRLFLIILATIIFLPEIISAEIANPYVVDEKTQVAFGDSTATSTYYGLENYTYNYVNNYLHITFTYTHHLIAFASEPPRLYITGNYPVATTTPNEKDRQAVYQLLSFTHPTDWYFYDAQFDSTGYTVKVLQASSTEIINEHRNISGITTSDYAALANGYLNQGNTFSMAFTPLPIYSAPATPSVATTTPVIIVPGIAASSLIKDNNSNLEVWLGLSQMLVSINDSYLDDLVLSSTGGAIDGISITANNIIRNTTTEDFFSGLFTYLQNNNLDENEDLFEFPYDWRLDTQTLALSLK